jgi:hypothetical protein
MNPLSFFSGAWTLGILLAVVALGACTGSEETLALNAGLGDDCGELDQPLVVLQVLGTPPVDSVPVSACPAYTFGGVKIRVLEGQTLVGLQKGEYTGLSAGDCRGVQGFGACAPLRANVTITAVEDTEVRGRFRLFDTTGVPTGEEGAFRARRCMLSPHCG